MPSFDRAPKLQVLAGGVLVSGAVEAKVHSTNHFSADRFSVLFAIDPADQPTLQFWSSATSVLVEVRACLDDGDPPVSLILGYVDTVGIDLVSGVARVVGRDLTVPLLETPVQDAFLNRTSSEVATIMATRHDLMPIVTATAEPIGRYYESNHQATILNTSANATSEWDLLCSLAREEQFDVFVQGERLYFQPIAVPLAPYKVIDCADLTGIHLARAIGLDRRITVRVKSWNSSTGMPVEGEAISAPENGASSSDANYVIVRPNLTPDRATALAAQSLADFRRFGRTVDLTMPGDLSLMPRHQVLLVGTQTSFDGIYRIETVDRAFSLKRGFTQRVRASRQN